MGAMPPSVAVTSTVAMIRAAEALGVPTADLLEQAGVGRRTLEDPDARLPGPVVLQIWDGLRERANDPALQLTAPTVLPFGAYRVIDYLVAASATLGDGVRAFARFFGIIAEAMELTIEKGRRERCLRLDRADGEAVPPVYVDYIFAAVVGRIRMHIRPELRVARVELRQPAPRVTAPYTRAFCAPVHFGAAADRLWFSEAEWRAPTQNPDAALARVLEEHARILEASVPRSADPFLFRVRRATSAALPGGALMRDVARQLHMSVRTLQRKLAALGTSYRDVSDVVRRELAEGYLNDPGVSVAEVAFLLGFSDQTSFHRAFRRWTGQAPGRWRRAAR